MVDNTPRILAGRYEVGELIGRGGMAEVHIGYDSRLSRTVAIKLLRTDLARDSIFHARFRREAQSAAALNHPAIVAVYDTGEEPVVDAAGTRTMLPFIVMEYVEGHTVRELLKDGAAVPIDEAVEITVGVLGALEYAHNEGIVHRDIKPGNVMLTPTGQVKVMDFGIARAMADSQATMTQTNSVVGTAQYLSPEQARGETVDARSDLYSTGCLLYELLAGRPPFQGDSPVSVAYQHVREIPVVPSAIASDVPESLDRVVMKALAKDREERYLDANQFRADLLAILHGGTVSAPAAASWASPVGAATAVIATGHGLPEQTRRGENLPPARPLDDDAAPQRKWMWVAALAGLTLILLGAIFLLGQNQGSAPVPVPDVKNMTVAQASKALEAAGFQFVQGDSEPSAEVEQGKAIRSEPAAGSSQKKGATIRVVFSSGPDMVTIPDVKGLDQARARSLLESAGLKVSKVDTEDAPGVKKDDASKTVPEAGEKVQRNAEVVLWVGTGDVVLPDLKGMEEAAAAKKIRDELKLVLDRVEEDSPDVPAGRVIRTEPAASKVAVDSRVTLVISKGAPNKKPEIRGAEDVRIPLGSKFDPRAGVTAFDPEDGDITGSITIRGTVNTAAPGKYELSYQVKDKQGLAAEEKLRIVTVESSAAPTPSPTPSGN